MPLRRHIGSVPSGMRVATWNLEKGHRRKSAAIEQLGVLERCALDIAVLTEPAEATLDHCESAVTSAGRDSVPPWVAIVGDDLIARGEPRMLSAAAETDVDGRRVLIYGSVLPWTSAPSHIPEVAAGRSSEQFFLDELASQVSEIRDLCRDPDLTVIWAGDFNQSLVGPLYGGSARRRRALVEHLDVLGFEAWNRLAPHAVPGLFAIDLICGPSDIAVVRTDTIPNTIDDRVATDHAGYVVEVHLPTAPP